MSDQLTHNIQFNEIVKPAPGQFHGGIHPAEFKSVSNTQTISTIDSPRELVIPLKQSAGLTATPIVSVGDKVVAGQLIAKKQGAISANLHTPLAGEITLISPKYAGHPSGMMSPTVTIQVDDDQDLSNQKSQGENLPKLADWTLCEPEELISQIALAGIVGLGGATFPTNVKLKAQSIETLIVNAMECEPYITCDDRLLREQPERVLQGALIAARATAANNIIFAIEDNKAEAIASLSTCIKKFSPAIPVSIVVAPTKYPSGGEKQTIELITGQQVPAGQLPSALGLVIQNVATLHAIYEAIVNRKPLTRRLVTITGNLVTKPGNYWVPFGTPIEYIMQIFSISQSDCKRVIIGGPLMGNSITNFSAPVTKATNCLIFNRPDPKEKLWLTSATKHDPCIRCGECETACPVELLPQQLLWFSQSDQWENLENQGLFDCIECGACAYVCPSEIPLVQYYRYGKSAINKIKQNQINAERAKQRFDFREMRIARTKAERALKHQKAAEARQKAAENKPADPTGKQTAINDALARVKAKKAALNEPAEHSSNPTNNKVD